MQEDVFKGFIAVPKTLNRYMYVAGNPVMYYDSIGHLLSWVMPLFVGALSGMDKAILWGTVAGGIVTDAIIGIGFALTGGVGLLPPASTILAIVASVFGNYVGQVVTNAINNGGLSLECFINIDIKSLLLSALIGLASGIIGSDVNKILQEVVSSPTQAAILETVFTSITLDVLLGAFYIISNDKKVKEIQTENPSIQKPVQPNETTVIDPCIPNYRYNGYDNDLDVLYDQLNKLESTGCTSAISAVNNKIKSIETEKVTYIDSQIDRLNDQMNKLEGVGALSAVRSIQEEIRKLEEDKVSVSYNVTKPTTAQPVIEKKKPTISQMKKIVQSSRYSLARPMLMAK